MGDGLHARRGGTFTTKAARSSSSAKEGRRSTSYIPSPTEGLTMKFTGSVCRSQPLMRRVALLTALLGLASPVRAETITATFVGLVGNAATDGTGGEGGVFQFQGPT